jgi:iron complex transport system permease protein
VPGTIPPRRWGLFLAAFSLAALVYLLLAGAVSLGPVEVFNALLAGPSATDLSASIVWDIRLPRMVAAALGGIGLALVGATFQPLLRNSLADPFVLGASGGAAVGGTIALIAAWHPLVGLALATLGAMAALAFVLALASRGGLSVDRLIIAGVVVGTLLSSVLMLLLTSAGEDANRLLRWLFGSTTPPSWTENALMAGTLLLGGLYLFVQRRAIDALAFGDDEAFAAGIAIQRVRLGALAAGAVVTGAIVGALGIIGFVGLVAPHIARRLVGAPLERSFFPSLLTGGTLLLLADILAVRILPGRELPLGVVTALVGAPLLLGLLRSR